MNWAATKKGVFMRPPVKIKNLTREEYKGIIKRSRENLPKIFPKIIPIIEQVKDKGDEAVLKFTRKFDKVTLSSDQIRIKKEKIKEAYRRVSPQLIRSLKKMKEQIEDFHRHQIRKNYILKKSFSNRKESAYILGERFVPVKRAAVYVPGGKADYPSTAIMGVVPAKLAKVSEVIVASPPEISSSVMVASDIAGADLLINVGGPQAIAALACGTQMIPRVDIVVGPGNIYVTAAKSYLASLGEIGIDCPAGPSEILIIADDQANPIYIAWDIIAQAEHDENACSILVTTSKELANKVYEKLRRLVPTTLKKAIIQKSLANYGAILIVDSIDEATQFANDFAPEHLEIITAHPDKILSCITNAGSVFLGPFSPVAAGDYLSGTNHILPTGSLAKFFSGLSVETFLKRMTYQKISPEALKLMQKDIANLAKQEGYQAHLSSIQVRLS